MPSYDLASHAPGADSPARSAAVVTPDDASNLPGGACRALYIGVSGDVNAILVNDTNPVAFVAVPVGVLPISVLRVLDAGTDAQSIVALY